MPAVASHSSVTFPHHADDCLLSEAEESRSQITHRYELSTKTYLQFKGS